MTMRSLTGIDFTGSIPHTEADHLAAERYARYSKKPAMAERPKEASDLAATVPATGWKSKLTPLRLFLIFGCLAMLMTIWIWETTYVRSHMAEIERLKDERTDISKRNEAIQVEIAKLSSYERIERIASEKLGMRPSTEKPEMILLDADLSAALGAAHEK